MKTALQAMDRDVEGDMRDAAQQAAQRDGLSLGDWLDRVMTRSADALGLGLAELGPNERIEAVRQRLGWAEDEARRREGAAAPDSVRMRVEPPMSVRAVTPPAGAAGTLVMEKPTEATSATPAVSRQTAQRAEIEAKLNALFKALDHPVRRTTHAAMASHEGTDGEPAPREERARVLMGETAISPAQRLETAIAEISDRQSYLDSKLEADPLPARRRPAVRYGGPRAAAEDLRRQFGTGDAEQPSQALEPDDGEAPSAAALKADTPAPVAPKAAAPKASVFTSLQGGAAPLAPIPEAAPAPATMPELRDTNFDEVRALLDEMRPDRSIDSLGRHVEALTARLDRVIDRPASAEAMQRLSVRIEEVHAELSKRLAAAANAPALDAQHLDTMVREAVGRLDAERNTAPVLKDLQSGVTALAARLDAAQAGQDTDREALAALQGQIATMAATIERSEAEFAGLAGVKSSVAEIAARVEAMPGLIVDTTREAAARAAVERAGEIDALAARLDVTQATQGADRRTLSDLQAQVDTLTSSLDRSQDGLSALITVTQRVNELGAKVDAVPEAVAEAARAAALGSHPSTSGDAGDAAAARAITQVARDLAEFRDARHDADKRLNLVLAALNTSLERVVDRLGRLEDDMAETGSARQSPKAAPAQPVPVQPTAAPTVPASPAPASERVAAKIETPAEPMMLDAPILPSSKTPAVRVEPVDTALAETPDPASFIAAARRAARHAAQEQAQRPVSKAAPRPASGVLSGVEGPAVASRAESRGRRPLLLALAGLVLLLGAAQVVRIGLSSEPQAAASGNETGAATPAVAAPESATAEPAAAEPVTAPAAVAAQDGAPAQKPAEASASKPVATPAAAPARQALPTMAIGPAAAVAAAKVSENAARAAGAGLGAGLRTAAEGGNPAAQYEVGLRFAEGRGVDRDMAAAASWFTKAAEQGLAPAAYRLGSLYEKGLGVSRDLAQAMVWYQKAAEAGNVRAMHNLAVLLAEGAPGKVDYPAASAWFARAADAGVRDSQFNLAILYARGLGVEQNLGQSYQWFSLAAAQGDTDAGKKRDEVAQRLSPDALAQAKAAVAAFKVSVPDPAANDVAGPAGGWDAAKPQAAAGTKPAHVSSM